MQMNERIMRDHSIAQKRKVHRLVGMQDESAGSVTRLCETISASATSAGLIARSSSATRMPKPKSPSRYLARTRPKKETRIQPPLEVPKTSAFLAGEERSTNNPRRDSSHGDEIKCRENPTRREHQTWKGGEPRKATHHCKNMK